jgi:hypothetical protein
MGGGEHTAHACGKCHIEDAYRANLGCVPTQADRAAERRRAKLEKIQRQVKDGSLKIRKMTPEERKRYPTQPAKQRRR